MTVANLEGSEGRTFVILAGSLPTIKEWHGMKGEGVWGKSAQASIKGWSYRAESGLSCSKV